MATDKKSIPQNLSTYEKLLIELESEGKIVPITGQDHLDLMQELNQGLPEFNRAQKLQTHKAFEELRNNIVT
jgi:hypothetical protein